MSHYRDRELDQLRENFSTGSWRFQHPQVAQIILMLVEDVTQARQDCRAAIAEMNTETAERDARIDQLLIERDEAREAYASICANVGTHGYAGMPQKHGPDGR